MQTRRRQDEDMVKIRTNQKKDKGSIRNKEIKSKHDTKHNKNPSEIVNKEPIRTKI